MPIKTIRFQPASGISDHVRTFVIEISSDLVGYQSTITELLYGGRIDSIELPNGPRHEISPESFYKMRKHYRGVFEADLKNELRQGTVVRRRDQNTTCPTQYLRANLRGWPDGFTGAIDDDMDDWIKD